MTNLATMGISCLEQSVSPSYNCDHMALRTLSKSLPRPFEGVSPTLAGVEGVAGSLALIVGEKAQLLFARQFAFAAVKALWEDELRGLNVPMPSFPAEWENGHDGLSSEILAAVRDIVELSSKGGTAWRAFVIGHCYTCMLPGKRRSETGAFHTPPEIAKHLMEGAFNQNIDILTARVLDPAAGAGAFIIPIVERVLEQSAHVDREMLVRSLSARIQGWELDPFAAWLSNSFVRMAVAKSVGAVASELGKIVLARDSLLEEPDGSFDLVIANPPYGRLKLNTELRTKFSRSLYGHANLYGVFTDLGLRALAENGVLALVTPTSFLGGQYFTKLRSLLAAKVSPLSVEVFDSRKGVFEAVLQETALTIYSADANSRGPCVVSVLRRDSDNTVSKVELLEISGPPSDGSPWILPRHTDEAQITEALNAKADRLADWGYRVKTGPLVWNRHKSQLGSARSNKSAPIIWAESIRPDGSFEFRHEKRNHAPFITLGEKDAWLTTDKPCILLQRTTSREQSRRLLMALLPEAFLKKHGGRVSVENHVNMILPTSASPAVPIEIVHAFLRTKVVDAAYRCISGSVAVSAYELESMPLPCAGSLAPFVAAYEARDIEAMEEAARLLYGVD